MTSDRLCQAQVFWNRANTAGWSAEQTRSQIRREAGVVQQGLNFIFCDGSVLREKLAPLGRELIVCDNAARPAVSAERIAKSNLKQ